MFTKTQEIVIRSHAYNIPTNSNQYTILQQRIPQQTIIIIKEFPFPVSSHTLTIGFDLFISTQQNYHHIH